MCCEGTRCTDLAPGDEEDDFRCHPRCENDADCEDTCCLSIPGGGGVCAATAC